MTSDIHIEVPHYTFGDKYNQDMPDYDVMLNGATGSKLSWLPPPCLNCGIPLHPNNVHVYVVDMGHGVYMLSYRRECGK